MVKIPHGPSISGGSPTWDWLKKPVNSRDLRAPLSQRGGHPVEWKMVSTSCVCASPRLLWRLGSQWFQNERNMFTLFSMVDLYEFETTWSHWFWMILDDFGMTEEDPSTNAAVSICEMLSEMSGTRGQMCQMLHIKFLHFGLVAGLGSHRLFF